MTNLEYERSFNVKDIQPFIDYCVANDFTKEEVVTQNRIVFENKYNSKIISRLTTDFCNGSEVTVLDFKNVNLKKDDLNVSTESLPLTVTEENKQFVMSLLQTLEFFEVANNLRTRYVYSKQNIKFEIDDYTRPQMKVVAIEGNKEEVDLVYEQIKHLK